MCLRYINLRACGYFDGMASRAVGKNNHVINESKTNNIDNQLDATIKVY